MKFIHCPYCGEKLGNKEIGDEGAVPFCEPCNRPIFDLPYTCIITLVVNELNEFALIKQGYVSNDNLVCVAGYIKTGETAETTALREVEEELGIKADSTQYMKSYYYEKRDMLMLGFVTHVKKQEFQVSNEVDQAYWFSKEEAINKLRDGSVGFQLLNQYLTN